LVWLNWCAPPPRLLMERGRVFETLAASFYAGRVLYAYGPLIHDLRCLPAHLALRRAGSLGAWGVPKQHLTRLEDLREYRKPVWCAGGERLGTSSDST